MMASAGATDLAKLNAAVKASGVGQGRNGLSITRTSSNDILQQGEFCELVREKNEYTSMVMF